MFVFLHVPLQSVSGATQVHAPVAHSFCAPHVVPHELSVAQYCSLDFVSTQVPPQRRSVGSVQLHVPVWQLVFDVHAIPQPPQSVLLVIVSMQLVPHWVVPCGHWLRQPPALQNSPGAQAFPHVPQLRPSEVRSTQAPLHIFWPSAHMHLPALQTCPPVHESPQALQLDGSCWRFAQARLQSSKPVGHASRQLPALQTWVALHSVPQAPQLNGSFAKLVHTPLQRVVPVGQ
jgi:hypothetical protein